MRKIAAERRCCEEANSDAVGVAARREKERTIEEKLWRTMGRNGHHEAHDEFFDLVHVKANNRIAIGRYDVGFRNTPCMYRDGDRSGVARMTERKRSERYARGFDKLNLETCASFHCLVYRDIIFRETLKKITKRNTNVFNNRCFVSSSETTHLRSLDDSDKCHGVNRIFITIAPTGRRVVELFTELGNKVRTALDVRVCSDRLIIFVIGVWKPSQLHTNYEKRIKPLPLWDGIKFKHYQYKNALLELISAAYNPNETTDQLQMHVLFALPVLRNYYTLHQYLSQSSQAYKFVAADIIAANELTSKLVD
ncbi:hypothetical protein ALC62_05299 [Cyphomyrmex costatus]|uniref:Uncharacterized protein n=1 Tax=Cyphomyrmex costatus TaxID=456900 RepID=A0A195CTG6_9HYME|nr:hypothetical protein ALC62_05299 [Cyphomyrmex costatus]